ncbi:hypothetical protein [Paenibacillus cymbidii]|uniref:hypothetical protein n=1 Tax=Paenibacillus cymbidii TaxID=1639034 RepID=UPI001081B413|nr:hypothetical protein [Paenibacillus cymbidii]
MYPVSPAFQAAVYAPSRRVAGKVTFDISDVTAAGDVSNITVTTQATAISDKAQLIDKDRNATYNLATLETDRFRLDGSFSFADDAAPANNAERGYVSDALCDSDGEFASHPTITITFGSTHSSVGLTITFDAFNGEYATDFIVTAYDASNVVIDTVTVTGNTSTQPKPLGQLLNYKKIVVEIVKWSVGDRRARVLEIDFGIVEVYTDDNLISMGLIEEMDMSGSKLPSPEFDFTVDNSDRAFNILNPTGFYKYLQQRQQVIAELGVDIGGGLIEYVPLGNYLLWEWTSDEGSLTASFTARTNLDLMANFDYENGTPDSQSLADLAESLFALCGIPNYSIDPALAGITTNSLAKKTTCKNALQMVALAGCANIFVTRDNTITLRCLSLGDPDDVVTLDNMYAEAQIELEKIVKQVAVTYWTDLDTSSVSTVTAAGVDVGDVLKLEGNTFINSSGRATAVANWLLAQKAYRAKYAINWRGNPAQELVDVILIENTYGSSMSAFITKTDLTYKGYLRAKTEAHGVVN